MTEQPATPAITCKTLDEYFHYLRGHPDWDGEMDVAEFYELAMADPYYQPTEPTA